MKILHTSDWHLGATFEGISREEDHKFFLSWLVEILKNYEIEVLIVAGDIFDQPQPSSESQKIYYQFLFQISQIKNFKKVIVVGGNHDSPTRLDAPSELLKLLDVFVVGGVYSDLHDISKYLCPIYNSERQLQAVIAAVPFIHEYRLGIRTAGLTESEIQNLFKDKINLLYKNLADESEKLYQTKLLIGTGHLSCIGSEKDDAPLEIHMVGTLGGLPETIFDKRFNYIALGHIHKSYRVANSNAYYSGSPICLSLKESKTQRCVNIVTFENNDYDIQRLPVPQRRKIIEIKGNIESINFQIESLSWDTPFPPILCVQTEVESYLPGLDLSILRKLENSFPFTQRPALATVKQSLCQTSNINQIYFNKDSLKTLSVEEVFIKMCENQNQVIDDKLLNAFRSLLNEENI